MKNSLPLKAAFPIADKAVQINTNSRTLIRYLTEDYPLQNRYSKDIKPALSFDVREDKMGQYHFLCPQVKFNLLIHNRQRKEQNWCVMETVKILSQYHLLKQGVLFLHASAIIHGGMGYVFAGYSGSGKSTISNKVLKAEKIADDQVVLWKGKGGYRIASSVFDSKLEKPDFAGVPLRIMFLLVQAKSAVTKKPITHMGSVLSFLVNNDLFNAAFEFYLNQSRQESQLHFEIASKLYNPQFKEKQFRLYLRLYKHILFEELHFSKDITRNSLFATIDTPVAK